MPSLSRELYDYSLCLLQVRKLRPRGANLLGPCSRKQNEARSDSRVLSLSLEVPPTTTPRPRPATSHEVTLPLISAHHQLRNTHHRQASSCGLAASLLPPTAWLPASPAQGSPPTPAETSGATGHWVSGGRAQKACGPSARSPDFPDKVGHRRGTSRVTWTP